MLQEGAGLRAGGSSSDEKEGTCMGLRLQLENGEIKEFRTWFPVKQVDGDHNECKSKCGIHWKREPDELQGCCHIDCAIKACGGGIIFGIIFALLLTGFSAFIIKDMGVSWIIIMVLPGIIILPVLVLALGYTNEKRKRELYEFRDYGTVNGIKAKMIESDSNLDVKGNRKGL